MEELFHSVRCELANDSHQTLELKLINESNVPASGHKMIRSGTSIFINIVGTLYIYNSLLNSSTSFVIIDSTP
jgi:hypothetical protein